MHFEPAHERRNCDLINLGSLTRQFPELSHSRLDKVNLHPKSALDVFSSISKLTRESLPDDRFTTNHKTCCVGPSLLFQATEIIDSVDGIELEPVASRAPPPQPTPPSSLSEILEQVHDRLGSPHFELVMRLTAVPNNTNFWQDVAVRDQATSDTRFAWCPKVTCIYCPGFEYSLFQHRHNEPDTREALRRHMLNGVHMEMYRRVYEERRRHSTTPLNMLIM